MPCREPEPARINTYTRDMNQAARDGNYTLLGWREQERQGVYSCTVTAWLAPDHRTFAWVGGGKIAGVDFNKTYMISRMNDGTYCQTCDHFTTKDVSELIVTDTVIKATFEELAEFHEQRLERHPEAAVTLSESRALSEFEQLDRKMVNRLVGFGLAEFVDATQRTWRFSWRGAYRSFRRNMSFDPGEMDRHQKRLEERRKQRAS